MVTELFDDRLCPKCKVLRPVAVYRDSEGFYYICKKCWFKFRIVDTSKPNPLLFDKVEDFT